MNAPENIATINAAHSVLLNAKDALCVAEVARAMGASKPTASKQLKELYGLGLIESEPRAGGTPFYRLIAEPKAAVGDTNVVELGQEGKDIPTKTYPPAVLRALTGDLDSAAPEDYEMPPADPALLAMANRELSERLEAKDNELFIQAKVVVDLRERIAQMDEQISSLTADVTQTRTALNHAINEADRLRRELTGAADVAEAAVGYLVKAPKLKPRRITKPEKAQAAALAAVRNGAARADVLALVPVGVARRGAEWQGIQPRTKGD